MKKGNLILLMSMLALIMTACKNDKTAKSIGKDITEQVSESVEKASDVIEETLEEIDLDVNTDTLVEGIGSSEVEELKKAEAADAKRPKVSKEKGSRPNSVPKPTANKNPESNPKPTKPSNNQKPTGTTTSVPVKPSSNSSTSTTSETEKVDESEMVEEVEVVEEKVEEVVEAVETGTPKPESKGVKDKLATGTTINTEPTKVGKITKPGSQGATTNIEVQSASFNHSSFNTLLGKFVSDTGEVNYSQLKTSGRALNAYCNSLSDNPPQDAWSKNEKLAYWLNAYNAFTLKLIADNFPIGSITELHGGKPWDYKWIKIGNQTLSLNGIENDIIRPRFKDARIHFGLNCAAKSCPPLANYAFTAENVNSKLNALTKSFINSNANDLSVNSISISKIFDWYKADFGNVIDYLNNYVNTKIDGGAKVNFMEYDWSLNGK